MKLFTGSEDPTFIGDPEGKCSTDDERAVVEAFFDNHLQGYPDEFFCISVRPDDQPNSADAYGFGFELKHDVIHEISVVCAGDVQDVICNAKHGEIRDVIGRFVILAEGASIAERMAILEKAIARAKESGKDYAEARVNRGLRRSDCIDPNAGEQEELAATLLALNEEDAF